MQDSDSVLQIKGIGEKSQKLYQKLGIMTVSDLLRHFPRDYEQFEKPCPVSDLHTGEICAVAGSVTAVPVLKKIRNLTIIQVPIRDESGSMQLIFFNMPYLQKALKPGAFHIFRGQILSRGVSYVMEQPRIYTPAEYAKLLGTLQPKYALTKGLTNQALQKAVSQALEFYHAPEEAYPDWIREDYALITRTDAIRKIHFPSNPEEMMAARKRLVFDEFFTFLIMLQKNKELTASIPNEFPMTETADTLRYVKELPYELTKGQKKVWQEIREDLEGPDCMNRLIQGDVGSGKTILAFLALLMTAANGFQGALMAPTEVLARQHFENALKDIEKYGLLFRPVLLVGSMTAKEKRIAYGQIASGEANLIIGTHALIQEKVIYKNLALVVTDEQHRFGVRQRESLAQKGKRPHVLVMSATPIPRTLAIILYGDLKISVIKELPADRLPIKNCVVGTSYRPKAYEFIASQIAKGHQAYVICPQVETGEMEDLENVAEYSGKLRENLPPSVKVAYLHGKMKASEKNRIMEEFAAKAIDVLVSTTVIEVGINVPNATVMMVENAERFGLAQLHQLRGRVGRGEAQSYCIFISTSEKKETMERLAILNHSNDGFYIASEDLKLRGPGDLFGVRQSGEFAFQIADIYTDSENLKAAAECVERLLKKDPRLELSENAALRAYLEDAGRGGVDFRTI